jgi:hypothetical protein
MRSGASTRFTRPAHGELDRIIEILSRRADSGGGNGRG